MQRIVVGPMRIIYSKVDLLVIYTFVGECTHPQMHILPMLLFGVATMLSIDPLNLTAQSLVQVLVLKVAIFL